MRLPSNCTPVRLFLIDCVGRNLWYCYDWLSSLSIWGSVFGMEMPLLCMGSLLTSLRPDQSWLVDCKVDGTEDVIDVSVKMLVPAAVVDVVSPDFHLEIKQSVHQRAARDCLDGQFLCRFVVLGVACFVLAVGKGVQ